MEGISRGKREGKLVQGGTSYRPHKGMLSSQKPKKKKHERFGAPSGKKRVSMRSSREGEISEESRSVKKKRLKKIPLERTLSIRTKSIRSLERQRREP